MKVIALTSTYPASKLGKADAVVLTLTQIRISPDGARKMIVSVD
jgi:hypothetical protein